MRKKEKIRYSTSSSLVMYIDDSDDDSHGNAESPTVKGLRGGCGDGKAACFSNTTPRVCGLMVPSAAGTGDDSQRNEVYLKQREGGEGENESSSSGLNTATVSLPPASPPLKPFADDSSGDAKGERNKAANSMLFKRRSVESIYFPPPTRPAPRPPPSHLPHSPPSHHHPLSTAEQETASLTFSENSGAERRQRQQQEHVQGQEQCEARASQRKRRLTIHLSTFVHMETPKDPVELGWCDSSGAAAADDGADGEAEEASGSNDEGRRRRKKEERVLREAGWRGGNSIRISSVLHTAVDLSRASILMDPTELYSLHKSFDPPTPEAAAAAASTAAATIRAELLKQRPLYPPPVPIQQAKPNVKRKDKLKAHTRHGRKQQDFLHPPLTPPPPPPPQGFPEEETRVLLELPLAGGEYHCVTVPRHGFRTVTHFKGWLMKQAAGLGQGPLSTEVSVYNYAKKAYDPLRSPACVIPYAVFHFGSGKGAATTAEATGAGGAGCSDDALDEKYVTVSSKTLSFCFTEGDGKSDGGSSSNDNKKSVACGQKWVGGAWDSASCAVADAIAFTNITRDCIIHVSIEEVTAATAGARRSDDLYDLGFLPQAFFLRPGEVVDVQATLAARCTLSLELAAVARFCIVTDSPEKGNVLRQAVTLTATVETPHTARLCLNDLIFEGSSESSSSSNSSNKVGATETLGMTVTAASASPQRRSARAMWRGNAVVVKTITKPSEKVGALLQAEAQTLFTATGGCPHFARFYGAVYAPGTGSDAHLVTEFCVTGTLRDALAGKPFPLLLKLKCLLDCAAGMRYLHSLSIVHKRLKPTNVLFYTRNPLAAINCKVTDVGSLWDVCGSGLPPLVPTAAHPPRKQQKQKHLQQQQSSAGRAGTASEQELDVPVYTAPEIIMGKPYGTPADVYSFAYIIWFVYFGYEAYTQGNFRTPQTVADYVTSGRRLPIPLDTPPALADMITHCWDKSQSMRPTFAQIEETLRHAYNTIAKKFGLTPSSPSQP